MILEFQEFYILLLKVNSHFSLCSVFEPFLIRVTCWVWGRLTVQIFEPFKPFSGTLMVETCIKGGLPSVPRHFWLVRVQKCLGYFAFIGQFDSWEWRGTWREREREREREEGRSCMKSLRPNSNQRCRGYMVCASDCRAASALTGTF